MAVPPGGAPLRVETRDGVWIFTLNRPEKRNALSAALVDALLDGVAEAETQQARLMVFRAEGRSFSAGFDFADVETQSEGDLLLRFVRIEMLLQAIAQAPCLTLGLAQGKNFGAGVDLFAACRMRIATPDATFRMPGLRFGLVLGTRRFGAIVGAAAAARILESSATFDAAAAASMGFATRIAQPEEWPAAIEAAVTTATALDGTSQAALYRVLGTGGGDDDLAELVRSAARPGLKERIARYLAG